MAVGTALICVREGAIRTARLVSIDLADGRERLVFDPNPSSGLWTLGSVRRLEWLNDIGNQVYGDLVLPPGYRGGRLPTIVVQYGSRGFLRGGTGNDYPIFLLAARGFAVLSIEKPKMVAASYPNITSYDEIAAINTKGWAERRNVHSAIVEGVKLLIADGIADPAGSGLRASAMAPRPCGMRSSIRICSRPRRSAAVAWTRLPTCSSDPLGRPIA